VAERRYPNVLLQSFVTGQLAAELLRRELEPAGMTPNQFGVQSVIRAFGPLTPTALAARLGMAPPTVSAWVKRLEASGQIRKLPHATDGRSYLLEVTQPGVEALEAAYPGFGAALARLEDELGPELHAVWEAGTKFEAALRAALESPSVLK
jgi:DNA-binding MarR family transcriptional regulator